MQVKIAPSLLAADFGRLAEEVKAVEDAGADAIHFDVMDGHFVDNLSMGAPVLQPLRARTRLPMEAHLMVDQPLRYIDAFRKAGADTITVHQEACGANLRQVLDAIHQSGARAGVALKPQTPLDVLAQVWDRVDHVLVMTVEPGFGGQKFLPEMLPKIASARHMIEASGRDITLEVDGGINPSTAPMAAAAGANMLVAGTAIFHQKDYHAAIQGLR